MQLFQKWMIQISFFERLSTSKFRRCLASGNYVPSRKWKGVVWWDCYCLQRSHVRFTPAVQLVQELGLVDSRLSCPAVKLTYFVLWVGPTTRLGGTSWAWGKPTWKNMFTKLIQNTPLSYRVNKINLGTHGNSTSPFPTSKLIAFSDLMHMVAIPHQSWLVLDCQWLAHNPAHNTMIG